MRWWPWKTKCRREEPAVVDVNEATRARVAAEAALRRAQEKMPEVREVAETSRHYRRVNHFAELINEAFRGRP